ncbi:MAG: hypothetical protein ACTTIM_06865 [Campylobacter sp.]
MEKVIMPTRMKDMQYAIDGIDRSNLFGIAYCDEYGFDNFANGADDKGLYYFTQIFHKFFNLNIEQIIILFHIIFIGFGLLNFCIGWILLLKNKLSKIIAIIATIILTVCVYKIGDVYIMFYFMSSFVPIFLCIISKNNTISVIIILMILSIFSLIAHIIRSYSFLPTILFVLVYLLLNQKDSRKYFYILILFSSIIVSYIPYSAYQTKINQNLLQLNNNANLNSKHVFWHSVYLGLGYVDNEYIPHYLDEVAIQKVNSINPSIKYSSQEYEDILKQETFKFIKDHKIITIQNLGAKFGVMFLYFIIFANIGFYCFFVSLNKKKREFLIPFLFALCFNSAFGFLTIPSINYLVGFISFSVIFAIYYIDNYINQKGFSK